MTTFEATTEGADKPGRHAVLERYANDQWLPDYYRYQRIRRPGARRSHICLLWYSETFAAVVLHRAGWRSYRVCPKAQRRWNHDVRCHLS